MLRATTSERHHLLEPELLIGRASACGLRIHERYVSARHAVLRWNGRRWELKDLGSRNGTFLNGRRIRPGDECPAQRGAKIAFGKLEQEWELVDDAPPTVMAVPVGGGEPVLLEGELLALPSPEEPHATVYRNGEGCWVLEHPDDATAPLRNLQMFEVAGRTYRFCSPANVVHSAIADSAELEIAHFELCFSVSRDDEQVELRASCAGRAFELGARSHHALLLTLARKRLADAEMALPDTTCGWVYQEDLARDLNVAPPQLNLDVFRTRKQFLTLGVPDAAAIIERRPRTRQLRIGTPLLSIAQL